MELVFLKAKQRLAKEISNKGTTPYPLTKNFTSEHVQISKTKKGLHTLLKTLQTQAASGACLHKGLLKRPLKNESRAMMADRVASTELLVLDIDGIQMPGSLTDVRTVAEKIIAQLPECFQDVSYIAQASASLGFKKDKVSMHFFFLLDQPTQPKILKEWFKLLNYETDILSSQLSLSANGQSLSYKLDPSVAENSKIIYIENKEHNSYASIKPRNWADKELGKTRTKNLITAYVEQLLSNKPVDWDTLGNIYRPDQKTPAATVRRLLKQEVVKDMVDKKLKEVLVNKGVTEEFVLDTMLEAIEIAKNKLDAGNLLKAADNLQDLLEMKPSKKIVTDTLEIGSSTKLLDEIEENENKMKLQRKTEEPINE